jgi:tripartite-type tricarboxylate transporter receptor subunit TctC
MRTDPRERQSAAGLAQSTLRRVCGAVLSFAFFALSAAHADPITDFYRNKTLTLVVGSAPGGGYDLNARVLSRFFSRHLPGHPTVVVENMPGASSLVAANYVYNAAPRDGTVIATVQRPIPFERLFSDQGARFDVAKINWLGSTTSEPGVVVAWASAPQKTAQDLLREPMIVGGVGPDTDSELFAHALNHLIGAKFNVVSGYPGQSATLLAMERGEIQGLANLSWSDVAAVRPDWISQHKIRVLLQLSLVAAPDLPDVPLALTFATDPGRKQILQTILEMKEIGRPYFAPPGVPADRLEALRAAFIATMNDPDYRQAVAVTKGTVDPVSGGDMQAMIGKLADEPTSFVAQAQAALR